MPEITFLNNDAAKLDLDDKSIDLIITAPPYFSVNTDRYGGLQTKQINHTSRSEVFVEKLITATKEMSRVLKDTGTLIINIGNNDNCAYKYAVKVVEETDFQLNSTMILNFSEDIDLVKHGYNLELSIPQTYVFWFILNKKGHRLFMHPFEAKKKNLSVINLPPNNERHDQFLVEQHIAYVGDTFPQELADLFIRVFSRPKQTVLNPFGGSGLVAIRALMQNRNAITNDISPDQVKLARARYENYLQYDNTKA